MRFHLRTSKLSLQSIQVLSKSCYVIVFHPFPTSSTDCQPPSSAFCFSTACFGDESVMKVSCCMVLLHPKFRAYPPFCDPIPQRIWIRRRKFSSVASTTPVAPPWFTSTVRLVMVMAMFFFSQPLMKT